MKRKGSEVARSHRKKRTKLAAANSAYGVLNLMKMGKKLYGKVGKRTAKKKSYSHVKTSQEKEETLELIAPHNSVIKERIFINLAKKKHRNYKTVGQGTIYRSCNTIFTSVEGKQGVDVLPEFGNRNMLYGSVLGNNSFYALPYKPDDVDPNVSYSGNNVIGTTNPGPNYWYFLDSVHGYTTLTNLSAVSVNANVFYLMCLKDTIYTPTAWWQNILTSLRAGIAAAANPTGVGGAGFAGWMDQSHIGESPFKHSSFRKAWKVKHHCSVLLKPGENHVIEFTYNYKKPIGYQWLQNQVAGAYLAGISIVPIVIYNGMVAVIKDGTNVGVTNGIAKLGILHAETVKLRGMPKSNQMLEIGYDANVSGVSHANVIGVSTGESVINTADQLVQVAVPG